MKFSKINQVIKDLGNIQTDFQSEWIVILYCFEMYKIALTSYNTDESSRTIMLTSYKRNIIGMIGILTPLINDFINDNRMDELDCALIVAKNHSRMFLQKINQVNAFLNHF